MPTTPSSTKAIEVKQSPESRPNTRAWTKITALDIQAGELQASIQGKAPLARSRPGKASAGEQELGQRESQTRAKTATKKRQRHTAKKDRQIQEQDQNYRPLARPSSKVRKTGGPSKVQGSNPLQKAAHPRRSAQKSRARKDTATQPSEILGWTQGVTPNSPPEQPERHPSELADLSSPRERSTSTGSSESTMVLTDYSRKSSKTFTSKLLDKSIDTVPSKDGRLKESQNLLKAELPNHSNEEKARKLGVLKDVIVGHFTESNEQSYLLLDTLTMHLDKTRNDIRYPFTPAKYFTAQIQRCEWNTEHVFNESFDRGTRPATYECPGY